MKRSPVRKIQRILLFSSALLILVPILIPWLIIVPMFSRAEVLAVSGLLLAAPVLAALWLVQRFHRKRAVGDAAAVNAELSALINIVVFALISLWLIALVIPSRINGIEGARQANDSLEAELQRVGQQDVEKVKSESKQFSKSSPDGTFQR